MQGTANLKSWVLIALLIGTVLIVLTYSPSLSVPLYLDDVTAIAERQDSYLSKPVSALWLDNERRSLSYSTLWLDTRIYGDNVVGFHVTNIVIHVLAFIAAFGLALLLARVYLTKRASLIFAIAVSVLWAVHPLNSQAVIYIVQRMAMLSGLFSILAVLGWLVFRVKGGVTRYSGLAIALCSASLAWHSKENALVIPVLWLALEIFLGSHKSKSSFIPRLPSTAFIVALIVALIYPILTNNYPSIIEQLDAASRQTQMFSRSEYFWIQQEILVHYIGTWFWPDSLSLFLPYAEGGSWDKQFGYFLINIALIAIAIVLRAKLPYVALGILFFYSGHLVESMLIPIEDLAFEHRNYLPSFGLALATSGLILNVGTMISQRKLVIGALSAVIGILCILTFQRATEWQSPQTFYLQNYELASNTPRAKLMWAIQLAEQEDYAEAEKLLKDVVDFYQRKGTMNVEAANNYLLVMQAQGKVMQSISPAIKMLTKVPAGRDRSLLLTTLSQAYLALNGCYMAKDFLQAAIEQDAGNRKAHELLEQCEN